MYGLGDMTDSLGIPLSPTIGSPAASPDIWSGFQVSAVAPAFDLTSTLQQYSTYIYVGAATLLLLALFGGRR